MKKILRKPDALQESAGRSLVVAFIWLILFPVVDVTLLLSSLSAHGLSHSSIITAPVLYSVLSSAIYWFGLFALLSVISQSTYINRDIRHPALNIVFQVILVFLHLYFLLLWSSVALNGHWPNPEAITFLLDNLSRLPQHVLQTSPLLVVAAAIGSITLSRLTGRSIYSVAVLLPVARRRDALLAGFLFVTLSYLLMPFGFIQTPTAFALLGSDKEKLDSRVNTYVSQLGSISSNINAEPPLKKYPVIVILVESLRHDLLTQNPEAIPFLKSLHERYVGFNRAYATASHSNLSDLAFWYSRYPLKGRGREGFPSEAKWRGKSLFSVFREGGYKTAYISSQNERWGDMRNWLNTSDVDHFFDSESFTGETWENFDDLQGLGGMIKKGLVTAGKIEDSQTLELGKQWIAQQSVGDGFFLGMNLQNTHFSYVLPPGGLEPYKPAELGFKAIYYRWPEEKRADVRNRYLNAVHNVDRMLSGFADYLKKIGIWDESLIVILGDNGEAFYEHGFGNHSGPMYDEVVRTFAVLKPPLSLTNEINSIDFPVSHIDIASTVPALLGLGVSSYFQGIPQVGAATTCRPVFMYSNAIVRQYGIVAWPWKLLVTEYPESKTELFNLESDPRELSNLSADMGQRTEKLTESLNWWVAVQKAYYAGEAYNARTPPKFLSSGTDVCPSDIGVAK